MPPVLSGHAGTHVTVDGERLLFFGGCDYLGLAHHPAVIRAVVSGLRDHGVSAGASPRTTGTTREHRALEDDLAAHLGVDAVALLPDGYVTNLAVAQSLSAPHTSVAVDEESHPSVLDGLAAAGLHAAPYAHLDAADAAATGARVLWTDGVFPTTGRAAPLPALLDALPPDGLVVVDDAHAIGVIGPDGRGSLGLHGVRDPRVVVTGSLSKALGCAGGLVGGDAGSVRRVRERSRAYAGSTALAPALARGARTALSILRDEPERRARLHRNILHMREALERAGLAVPDTPLPVFVVVPPPGVDASALAGALRDQGILAPRVRYLSTTTLRWTVSSEHTADEIVRLADAVARALARA